MKRTRGLRTSLAVCTEQVELLCAQGRVEEPELETDGGLC